MGVRRMIPPLVTIAVILIGLSEGLQIPQFLKQRYGNQYGQPNEFAPETVTANSQYSNPYVKTKSRPYNPYLKTKTKSSYHTKTKTVASGGCSAMPPSPMNAGVRCSSYGGCRADCISDFQFPNGQTYILFSCVNGEWKVSGDEFITVPSCEPICLPQCQNNGICVAPNQCQCPENFSGPQCQFEKKPCLNYPPIPMNARRICHPDLCTVTCMTGHEFPDGSQIATMVCKDGLWVPGKEKWISLPDCKPTCDPPCLNGGNCLSFNVCQCPRDFRGPQCQYSADVCSAKKLPHNGGYNCSGNAEFFSCAVSCPEGINFEFQPEQIYTCYYSVGVFEPTPIPKCVYPDIASQIIKTPSMSHTFHPGNDTNRGLPHIPGMPMIFPGKQHYPMDYSYTVVPELFTDENIHQVNAGHFGRNEQQLVTIEQRLPKPGYCFHWSGTHYKTFDSQLYSVDSKCPHILVTDSADNTFSIVTQNHEDCYSNPINCYTMVKIYLQNKEYQLKRNNKGIPVFSTPKKVLPIPGQQPGVRVEMLAHHILVSLDSVGAKVKWDGQQLVQIEVLESLWNRTEGLCGKIDGDPENDILTRDHERPRSVSTLAASWKVEDLGADDACDDSPVEDQVCQDTGVKDSIPSKATFFCKKLLSDKRFSACHNVIDISLLLDACRWDYCNCKENDRTRCACETLDIYVQDCTKRGVKGLTNWRDENTCL